MATSGSIHLYGIAGAGSLAAEFLLAIAGADYSISFPDKDERSTPEYLAISPKGQIPVLVDEDGHAISESIAIIITILERIDTGMIAPVGHPARGKCLQWLSYLATVLYNANQRIYQGYRFSGPEVVFAKSGMADRRHCYDELENALSDQAFLCGDEISAADLYLFMLLKWDRKIALELDKRPKLKALFTAVSSIPQVQDVLAQQPKT